MREKWSKILYIEVAVHEAEERGPEAAVRQQLGPTAALRGPDRRSDEQVAHPGTADHRDHHGRHRHWGPTAGLSVCRNGGWGAGTRRRWAWGAAALRDENLKSETGDRPGAITLPPSVEANETRGKKPKTLHQRARDRNGVRVARERRGERAVDRGILPRAVLG